METIPEDSTNQNNQNNQTQAQRIEISPLQLLVNAVFLGYQRGVYTMKEAGIISQAIDFFTIETKQAIVPISHPASQASPVSEASQVSDKDKDEYKNTGTVDKVIMQSQ